MVQSYQEEKDKGVYQNWTPNWMLGKIVSTIEEFFESVSHMTLLLEILSPLLLFPLAGPLLRIIVHYIGCGA